MTSARSSLPFREGVGVGFLYRLRGRVSLGGGGRLLFTKGFLLLADLFECAPENVGIQG